MSMSETEWEAFLAQAFPTPLGVIATAHDAATVEQARAIARRYLAPDDVDGYVAEWSDLRTIVTITPYHIVSWSAGG